MAAAQFPLFISPISLSLLILELLEGDVEQGIVGGDPDPSFNSLL